MKLREHPLMSYRGISNWPPLWCHTGKPSLRGEIGVLASADCDRTGRRCYLSMDFQNERYIGTLLFNDFAFCVLIAKALKTRIGLSIKEIGDLDFSFTL
jgi:hypothetical protein